MITILTHRVSVIFLIFLIYIPDNLDFYYFIDYNEYNYIILSNIVEIMNKTDIITILYDWNFWKKDLHTGIPRDRYVSKLKDFLGTNQVVVITGARRAGKSYIMRQMVKWLIENKTERKNICFINFDDPRFINLDTQLLTTVYETYLEFLEPTEKPYIFLDEIQEVDGWEKWVRMIHELQKAVLIISGSNAKLLSKELGTLLTGRHLDLTVFPLDFREFLGFNNINLNDRLDQIANKTRISGLLHKYLEYGAFPEVTISDQKKEILLNYFDDLIHKDLVRRFKIRKHEPLKALVNYYLSNISSPSTFNSISHHLDISVDTIEKYTGYLEQIFLVFSLKRFSAKVKAQEKSPRKIYCIDVGLSNVLGFKLFNNYGLLIENVVFLELKRRQVTDPSMEIFYWKDIEHREVDFIIRKGLEITDFIQVCWDPTDEKTKKREIQGIEKAIKELDVKDVIIITGDYKAELVLEGENVRFVPLLEWILDGWE